MKRKNASKRHAIKAGTALAIEPKSLHAGRDAFFWLWSSPRTKNERVGTNAEVAVVHIRGPLEHHDDCYGDSYDAIRKRVGDALSGDDVRRAIEERQRWARYDSDAPDADPNATEAEDVTPPRAVILRFDSPGGVVSGLNECAKALRAMAARAGIPLIAYVDEMAASAAYALASACSEIYLPPSAITGSVGVISTMVDQTGADAEMGLRFVTITSGARKADGHPHVAISDDAIRAERGRVNRLAGQFYRLVQRSRGMSVAKIQALEAGIFVGIEAVRAGLADGVMAWEELLAQAAQSAPLARMAHVVSGSRVPGTSSERSSMLKLKALLATKKKARAEATSKKRRAALDAEIAHLKATLAMLDAGGARTAKTTHTIEHKEKHVADDGDEDDVDDGSEKDDDEEEEDEDEEESEAGGNETDRSDEEDEDEEAGYSESEEEAAAGDVLRSAIAKLPKAQRAGMKGALAGLVAKANALDAMSARVAKIEKDANARAHSTLIDEAKAARRITPHQAKQLRSKPLAFVRSYLEMHTKPLVNTDSTDLAIPRDGKVATGKLDAELEKIISHAISSSDGKLTREAILADYAKTLNGAGGAGSY